MEEKQEPPPYPTTTTQPQPVHPDEIQMQTAPKIQAAVTSQPPAVAIPSGLDYLTHVDQLLIHQQVELLEVVTNWETCNKYQIKNTLGQPVYFAAEESGFCTRQCCGPSRGFVMHISDNYSQEAIRVIRDFKCCAARCNCFACCRCCQPEIIVEAPVGQVAGYVRQECSLCRPCFVVENASKEVVFTVQGPCCRCQCICCPKDVTFEVSSAEGGQVIGKVYKQWGGLIKEMATDADNFGVNFPMDLDIKLKAVLLGSVFLIDFMFWEERRKKKKPIST